MSDPEGSSSPLLFLRTPRSLQRARLRRFAQSLLAEVSEGRPFTCLVTDDRELRRLNRTFLGKDYATDVLSFPSPAPEGSLGEMAVSVNRAADQAAEFGHSVEDEISILMLHGLLHLLGMDHETDGGEMREAEVEWRSRLGLPVSLIERNTR